VAPPETALAALPIPPKAEARVCKATGNNANEDAVVVIRQPSTNHPANGQAGEQPENPDCEASDDRHQPPSWRSDGSDLSEGVR
jgi:hypothetical protein